MDHQEELKFCGLLERIGQPLYIGPKGHGTTKFLYNLPPDHLKPFEREAMVEFRKMLPSTTTIVEVPVYHTSTSYDLQPIQQAVPKNVLFSEFNETHLKAAADLTRILMSQPNKTEFFNACALCRDSVNVHLWVHAFTRAVLRRPDMRGFRLPVAWEIMPDMFIESRVWKEAVKQATLPMRERAIIVIDKNFTGTNLDPNHKVAYFTEDIGVNSHHWHWHLTNPFSAPKGSVDRKGEIFYYMHHGMLARYNTERLANGLNQVVPFDIHKDVVEEACFPKLTIQNSSINFYPRQINSVLHDFDRSADPGTGRSATISDLRSWSERITEAIDAGFAITDGGSKVSLRTEKGIDIVTAMWESSMDSPNRVYYGILHNYGHSSFGIIHDPDFRYRVPPGVMYLPGTAMRDPVFFRWHKYLDLISQRQKDYLPLYTHENLQWAGVVIDDFQVVRGEDTRLPLTVTPINNLVTFWMQSDIELSRGLDFGRTNLNGLGSVWVRATHLQHLPFTYRIRVTNQTRSEIQATVRIFMAPQLDENGDKIPYFKQRILMFEMDKFTQSLQPGENVIIQKSESSTLTVPWSQTFREIERDTASLTRAQAICSCGWPDHLLLPRGTVDGMPFDLFVMLTNHQVDQVPSSKRQLGTLTQTGTCRDSVSYCGMIDDKFPDSRPMGYPFDRPAVADEKMPPQSKKMLADFVTPVSNMKTVEIKIFHVHKTILRGNGAPDNLRKLHVSP